MAKARALSPMAAQIGATAVARAKPDGYTMLMLTSTHAVGETLYKTRPYDLARDFTPIGMIGTSPYWLLVNPDAIKVKIGRAHV